MNKLLGELLVKYAVLDAQAKELAKQAAAIEAEVQTTMEANKMKEVTADGGAGKAGPQFHVEAKFVPAEKSYVDVAALKKLCPDEKLFLKVVTATQKSVTEHLGGLVLDKCLKREAIGDKFKLSYKVALKKQ